MKKRYAIVLVALALAAFCAASCLQSDPIQEETKMEGIVLRLDTGDMQLATKAQPDTRPGDEDGAFNENLLSGSAQVFFFDTEAGDDTPARWNQSIPITGNLLQIQVTMADLAAMFGSRTPQAGAQATVIVTANYDGAAFDMAGHKYTKNEIKAMQLASADWSQHPQDYFVMLSDETVITLIDPTSITPATGTVQMRRRAAKVTFRLTIAEEIAVENYSYTTDTDGNITPHKSIELWRPVLDKMTVYSQYFMKDGVLGGTPTHVPNDKNSTQLFTGVDNPHLLVETTQTMARERNVFRTDDQGHYIQDEDGNYVTDSLTVDVPLFVTKFNDGDGNPSNDVDGPLYTYPVTWSPGIETEPFLKLIIPWQSGSDGRIKYYYYKVPFMTEALEANHWYEVTLDVQILGGEEELPVPLNATYHVVDWVSGTQAETATVQARYLSVPVKSFTMYNVEELEIPMISSHACEIVPGSVTITKPYYGTGTAPTYDEDDIESLTVVSQEEIYLKHTLNNTMGSQLDVAPYTIKFTVRHIDDYDYYADITVLQYPAIYMEPKWDMSETTSFSDKTNMYGNVFIDGYYARVNGRYRSTSDSGNSSSSTGQGGTLDSPYGKLSQFVATDDQRNMTMITVTSFTDDSKSYSINNGSEQYDYIIADPRTTTKSWNSLTAWWNGSETTAWTAAQIAPIKIAATDDEYRNYIAPQFMISSKWGRNQGGKQAWENAQRRCATYQEAGYPAGRWRLPTEAEVMFIVNLERYGYIEELFVNGTDYWIANQSVVTVNTSGESEVEKETSTTATHTQRCVYDTWYWGTEAPADHYTYTFWPEKTDSPVFTATRVN